MISRLSTSPLRLAALVLFASATAGCRDGHSSSPLPPLAHFDSVFADVRTIALHTADSLPLRHVNAGLVLDNAVFLSDDKAGDLKVFDLQTGLRKYIIGAPGDGPGDFRHVIALTPAGPGEVAILDQKRKLVSFRDTSGRLIREVPLKWGYFNSLVLLPAEQRLIAGGKVDEPSAKGKDLHEYDYSGRLLASFAPSVKAESEWASRFAAILAVRSGNTIVQGSLNSNRLRVIDTSAHSERWLEVAPGWFKPLLWPSDKALRRGYSMQRSSEIGMEWRRRQRLVSGIFALGTDRLLVRFQAYPVAGDPYFYYATLDTAGRTLSIARPTSAFALSTRGDTVFWLTSRNGTYRLGTRVYRRSPSAPAQPPAPARVVARQ